jgi:putative ABC transport system permease protein
MLRLTWSSVLARRANLVGSLLAVVIAVTTMFSAVILIKAAADGPDVTERLNATTLVVQADPASQFDAVSDDFPTVARPRLPMELVDRIEAVDGVEDVIPDVLFYAQLLDADGQLIVVSGDAAPRGQSWESAALTPFSLVEGTAPSGSQDIVIDRELADQGGFAVGDEVMVVSSDVPASCRITGIAETDNGGSLSRQSSIFFVPETAQQLANANRAADLLGVFGAPDVDAHELQQRVQDSLADAHVEVLEGASRARADETSGALELSDLVALLGVMSGFVGFVSIFVLASTFAFSIQQRYREIGLQRAIGVTPRQVWRMIAAEALILGIAGSAIGMVAGGFLARIFTAFAIRRGLAPEGFEAPFWIWAVPIVVGGAIAITQVAAFGAGRRASGIRPIEALREAAVPKKLIGIRRLLLGLAFLVGGVVVLGIAPSLAMDAAVAMSMLEAVLLMIGVAILGPIIVVPFTWIVGRLLAMTTGVTGDLARWNARRLPQRVASVVSPLMLAIGFATLMFALTATTQTATMDQTIERTIADMIVVPANEGLPMGLESTISEMPGVASAHATLPSTVTQIRQHPDWTEVMDFTALGVDPATIGSMMAFDFTSGGLNRFDGSATLLSEYAAGTFDVSAGDLITIYLEDMTSLNVTVAGVFSNGLGLADVLLPREVLTPHTTALLADSIMVDLAPGADSELVASQVDELTRSGYQVQAVSRDDYVDGVKQSLIDGEWVIYLIIGSAAVFAGLSVVNTMTMSTAERAREFALMRLVGATDRQVLAMIGGESAIVLLIGAATGITIGVTSMVGVSIGLTGSAAALTLPILPIFTIVVLAAVVSLAAHIIPATFALRADPIGQIGSRE